MELFTKRFKLELANGDIVNLMALSVTRTEQFKARFRELEVRLNDTSYKDITLRNALENNKPFFSNIQDLFDCFNPRVSVNDLAYDTIEKLLFPHEEGEEYHRIGKLVRFVVGETKGNAPASKKDMDTYAQNLANLLSIFKSFEDCMRMLDTLTPEDLNKVIKHYADNLKTPEERKKDLAREEARVMNERAKNTVKTAQKVTIGDELSVDEINALMGM